MNRNMIFSEQLQRQIIKNKNMKTKTFPNNLITFQLETYLYHAYQITTQLYTK